MTEDPGRPAITRHLVLARGALEIGLPDGWCVQPQLDETGALVVKDPDDEIHLDLLVWPVSPPPGTSIGALLFEVTSVDLELVAGPVAGERGSLRFAWIEDVYDCPDDKRNDVVRPAHCRWLLVTNGNITGQVRFFYWDDDKAWAIPIWETIIETVALGTGSPLASPADHWSLKPPS